MSQVLTDEIKERLDRFFAEDKHTLMFSDTSYVLVSVTDFSVPSPTATKLIMPLDEANAYMKAIGKSKQLHSTSTSNVLRVLPDNNLKLSIHYIDPVKYRRQLLADSLDLSLSVIHEYLDGREDIPF